MSPRARSSLRPSPSARVLERGDIFFFYRPRVEEQDPEGIEDIQRLLMVLSPEGRSRYRLIVIGRKRLPDAAERNRFWGFVDHVTDTPEELIDELRSQKYGTKTRGVRHLPAARPAGEGVYRLVRHDDHTHLIYALELPRHPNEVQRELNIERKADYIVSVMNPEQRDPTDVEIVPVQQSLFPEREIIPTYEPIFTASLQEKFEDRRFAMIDPPEFLDRHGAELVLIAVGDGLEKRLGIRLDPEKETASTAEIFSELHLDPEEQPLEPLFAGKWE